MNLNSDEPTFNGVRVGQSILAVTYVYRGSECLGLYFFDPSQGFWRAIHPDYEIFWNEAECKNKLVTGNPHIDA